MNALRVALGINSGNSIFIVAFGATAFAERSVAMKAPVGLLSGRAVCVSRWRGFAPTSSAERDKTHFLRRVVRNELPRLKPVGFASSPKGDGKPSQSAPAGRVQLPRRGSFGHLLVSTKSSHFGRAGERAPERVQPAEGWQKLSPQRRAFAESGAANAVSRYDPLCVKMRLSRSAERDKRKNKNNPSADDAQSTAEGILNRFVCPKRLSAEKQQTAFSAPHSCNLCNCDKFS